jgi:hypothetical protein
MVFLALLILPIVLAEYLLDLTSTQNVILSLISWVIYAVFVLEFLLKLLVAQQKTVFLKTNKFYTIISLVIIASPVLEPISELFAAAPFLRAFRLASVIRLSRLTSLLAVSGRARLSWRRIKFRTYAIVTSVIVFGFLISFFKPELNLSSTDQNLLAQLIQITATIYAIITGFIIANVWGKYTSLIRSANTEAANLKNIYLLSLQLKNQDLINRIKHGIIEYIQAIIETYWKASGKIRILEQTQAKLILSLNNFVPQKESDIEVYSNLVDEIKRTSESHASIKSLLASRTPKILWALITVLSAVLIFGFYLVSYDNQLLATLTMGTVSTAVALVAVIIYDMNDPFKFGFWAVSPDAYLELLPTLQSVDAV